MRRSTRLPVLLWVATLMPAVLIAVLIAENAVDMPYMDDWDLSAKTLILARTGRLGWGALMAQHNESRPFFPRLVFLAVGALSHGDLRWELWFNFGLACAVSYSVFRLARKTVTAEPWLLLGLTVLANLLIFTPKQAETWLRSTYVGLEPIVCLTAVLALLLSGLGGRTKLGLGMALSTVATYSYANGLSTWFVAAPLVALVLGWRALAHWVLGLTLNAAVYFDGYTRPWYHPALVEGLRPTRLAHYQLAFAGSPWGMDRLSVATLAGASVLVCFASALVYLMVRRPDRELWRKMLPWLAIGFYTLASGLLSGIGRVAWGVKMALLDRYIPFSLYIAVACVFLVPLVLRDAHHVGLIGPRLHRVARGVVASGIVLFLAFQAEATALGVRVIRQEGRMRRYAKSCLLLMNVHLDQECLSTRVYPNVAMLRGWAGELDRLGYLHPSLARGRLQGMHAPRSDVAAAGVFESFSQVTPQRYVAVGWAASPTRRAPADAVILALEDPHGVWVPWQIRPVEHPRPDVAARYGTEYVNVGWRRRVLQHELPLRPFRIGAWAFDAETAWVLPLERTYLVESDRTDR